MKPLTADEIAELRKLLDRMPKFIPNVSALNALPRLLDEVEELRKHLDAVSGPRWREDMEALTRARSLLKRIEWSGEEDGIYACPECRASHQHKPDCELAALLS
jgi:hypothetical protein